MVERTLEEENPYLPSIAFPCGPWSPWQRTQADRGTVDERRIWIPVFKCRSWSSDSVKKEESL